jgi:dTMP kinase
VIVAVEGGDAVGKATQTKLLAERLGGVRLAFPDYEQPAGKAILGHLKKEWAAWINDNGAATGDCPHSPADVDPLVFQCLQTVNRLEMLPVVRAAADAGRHLVFDRYTTSGIVYGMLDGVDPTWVELISASLPQPDLWLLLDVPVEEGFRRRPERRDRYEVDRAYLEKVRVGYLRLFEGMEQKRRALYGARADDLNYVGANIPWRVVDGLGTVEEVRDRIWAAVELARGR